MFTADENVRVCDVTVVNDVAMSFCCMSGGQDVHGQDDVTSCSVAGVVTLRHVLSCWSDDALSCALVGVVTSRLVLL